MVMFSSNIGMLVQNTDPFTHTRKLFSEYHAHDDGSKVDFAISKDHSQLEDAVQGDYGSEIKAHGTQIDCCCGKRFSIGDNGKVEEWNEFDAVKSGMVTQGISSPGTSSSGYEIGQSHDAGSQYQSVTDTGYNTTTSSYLQ